MIPNIFISSTIEDLHYLRDAIRDTVADLSYNPVMSEYGDVGYSPLRSAEGSCYVTLRQCQLAILIVGKRYGSISKNGLSVTHNEFRTARENSVPVITLVDAEVMAFKKLFDENKGRKGFSAPGMDSPTKTFELIADVAGYPINNGILPYTSVADARSHLKKQLAHLFGEFLRGQFDPVKAEVKDVLSEIKTLRHEMEDRRKIASDNRFLKAIRFLLEGDTQSSEYRDLLEKGLGMPLNRAVQVALESPTFDDLIKKVTGSAPSLIKVPGARSIDEMGTRWGDVLERLERRPGMKLWRMSLVGLSGAPEERKVLVVGRFGRKLCLNEDALEFFRQTHSNLLSALP